MPEQLPERPDLRQLRRRAKELLAAMRRGDTYVLEGAANRSQPLSLAWAQLVLARRYGFSSWSKLKREVQRRRYIDEGDVEGLRRLVAEDPSLAIEPVRSCLNDPTATAFNYIGVARFHGLVDHDRMGEMTHVLLGAGAPADGKPSDSESPLITAVSYGEVGMAKALIEAGADLERTGYAVPGGTALAHAVEFGMRECVDLLVGAGARVRGVIEAAGAGDMSAYDLPALSDEERAGALRAASMCERLGVIDELLHAGIDVDADTNGHGATALHWAAYHGKKVAVEHLLAAGADPMRVDSEHGARPLDWCRHRRFEIAGDWGHRDVERVLTDSAGR